MKAKRNLLALLLSVVMLWQGFSVVHAENTAVASGSNLPQSGLSRVAGASSLGTGHERQDVISEIRMTLNDQPINENTEIHANSTFALNLKLAVKGKAVNEGDYVELKLPSALSAKDENTELKAGTVTIANAHYDSVSKKLRITFTGDAATYSGADGEYKFYVRVNSSEVSTAQKIPMEIQVGGVSLFSLNMNYKGVGMDEEPNFWKNYGGDIETYVDKDGVEHFLIHFFIQINGRRIGNVSDKYTDVKIHDQLVSSVLSYVDPSDPKLSMNWANPSDIDRFTPKLVRGVWKSGERDSAGFHPVADGEARGHKWALQDLANSSKPAPVENTSLVYKEGKRAFDYAVGELNKEEGLELQYFVEVHEVPKNGSKYYNDASLTANQIETKLHHREVKVQASEGKFDVKPYILRIEKRNKEGAPLSGAKFTIRDTKTNIEKTVVTGADGIATWDNALLSEYEIKEIEAPDGYVLKKDASQTVTEEELRRVSGAEKPMVTKTFINEKPNDPEPNKPSDPKPNDPEPNKPNDPKPNDPEPNKPNDPKPSEPVPSNPGGSGNPIVPGGNTPGNPGGGGGNPRVPGGNTPGNPGDNGGTTPSPTTTNNPGEVLGASRPEVNETVKPGEVLGESRPAVRGRAAVATDDKSAMKLYAVLFMLSAVSFIGFSLYGKRNEKKRRRTK